ncbi:MAG: hypothetical protein KGO05_10055, partial [Chloroflexota bacterium]|nr:hypothetical protein [Chloroflexota bacterium]
YDRYVPASLPANVRIIAASPIRCSKSDFCPKNLRDTADSTIYTAASGAQVFDAGTFTWAWALSDISGPGAVQGSSAVVTLQPYTYVNPGFQQFTANILSALLAA